MKMGIDRERALEMLPGFFLLPEPVINHSGMVEKLRVLSAQLERVARWPRVLPQFAVLVKAPGQDIIGVDIAPVVQFTLRQLQPFVAA